MATDYASMFYDITGKAPSSGASDWINSMASSGLDATGIQNAIQSAHSANAPASTTTTPTSTTTTTTPTSTTPTTGYLTPQQVNDVYQSELGRDANYTSTSSPYLNSVSSVDQLTSDIRSSDEYGTYRGNLVQDIFNTNLGRNPNPEGADYWATSSISNQDLARQIYDTEYSNLSNVMDVTDEAHAERTLLNPDTGQVTFFGKKLEEEPNTIDDIVPSVGGYNPGPAVTTTQSDIMGASTEDLDPAETFAGQLNQFLDPDSTINKQIRANVLANIPPGMRNSSFAIQAVADGLIANAKEMAQIASDQYINRGDLNLGFLNDAAKTNAALGTEVNIANMNAINAQQLQQLSHLNAKEIQQLDYLNNKDLLAYEMGINSDLTKLGYLNDRLIAEIAAAAGIEEASISASGQTSAAAIRANAEKYVAGINAANDLQIATIQNDAAIAVAGIEGVVDKYVADSGLQSGALDQYIAGMFDVAQENIRSDTQGSMNVTNILTTSMSQATAMAENDGAKYEDIFKTITGNALISSIEDLTFDIDGGLSYDQIMNTTEFKTLESLYGGGHFDGIELDTSSIQGFLQHYAANSSAYNAQASEQASEQV